MKEQFVEALSSMEKAMEKELPFSLERTPPSIDHPTHYHPETIEAIKVIEAWSLNFNLGNVIKYIARAELKGSRRGDLLKALWYLERELSSNDS